MIESLLLPIVIGKRTVYTCNFCHYLAFTKNQITRRNFSKWIFHDSSFSLKTKERETTRMQMASKHCETLSSWRKRWWAERPSVRRGKLHLAFMSGGPNRMKQRFLMFFRWHLIFTFSILTNYSLSLKYQWWAAYYQIHLSMVPEEFHLLPLPPCQSKQPEKEK